MYNDVNPIHEHKKYWLNASVPLLFCQLAEKRWTPLDGIAVTSSSLQVMLMLTTRVLVWLSLVDCLKRKAFALVLLPSQIGATKNDFMTLGKPNLFFGITAGNMDSMINRYTADRKLRHDDAYTPNNEGGKRPDRATLVYSQRCREAYKGTPIVLGGIEASLRRIAHYDYWSDKVRRSVLFDAKADILLFGNAERALVEVAHRLADGEDISTMTDIRGTAVNLPAAPEHYRVIDSSRIEKPGKAFVPQNPYESSQTATPTKPSLHQKRSQSLFALHDTMLRLPLCAYRRSRSLTTTEFFMLTQAV